MKFIKLSVLMFLAFLIASCSTRKRSVDMVLTNADVQTMDPNFPHAEAVAVDNGSIVGVGTDAAVAGHFSGKMTLNLHGAYVLPGLIDGHAHMLELGLSLQTVDLSGTHSPQQVAKLVEEASARTRLGGWIRGSGWNSKYWHENLSRVSGLLNEVAPDNFVLLVSSNGGSIWVNSKVLQLAGINRSTKAPPGGEILHDSEGDLVGILRGTAIGLVTSKIPPPSEDEIEDAIVLASDTCARYGITEVQDAGITRRTLSAYKLLADQAKLKIRIYAMYDGNDTTLPDILKAGRIINYKKFFTMRSVRVDMDGGLGPRRAALVRQYSDASGTYGTTLMGEKDLENLTIASLSSGFQVCTEAHGDRANDVVLNAYGKALKMAGVSDPRLRIEGVDVLLKSDISRFKKLGIIPSMQPSAFGSEMYWLESRLGPERVKNAFVWKSLLEDGNIIVGGSDFPNESPDPRIGIFTAVTRRDLDDLPGSFSDAKKYFELTRDAIKDSAHFDGGFFPAQKMTLTQALKSFTVWPAYGSFQGKEKGSITVGKYADFSIFDQDLSKIPPKEIPYDKILATIVGGKTVYLATQVRGWVSR